MVPSRWLYSKVMGLSNDLQINEDSIWNRFSCNDMAILLLSVEWMRNFALTQNQTCTAANDKNETAHPHLVNNGNNEMLLRPYVYRQGPYLIMDRWINLLGSSLLSLRTGYSRFPLFFYTPREGWPVNEKVFLGWWRWSVLGGNDDCLLVGATRRGDGNRSECGMFIIFLSCMIIITLGRVDYYYYYCWGGNEVKWDWGSKTPSFCDCATDLHGDKNDSGDLQKMALGCDAYP